MSRAPCLMKVIGLQTMARSKRRIVPYPLGQPLGIQEQIQ